MPTLTSAASRPLLTTPLVHPNGTVELTVTGEPGTEYTFEASRNLATWFVLSSGIATNGSLNLRHEAAVADSKLFYRARSALAGTSTLKIYPRQLSLLLDEEGELLAFSNVSNSQSGVTWSSSHPDLVSVSSNGVVKAIAKGSAVITARAGEGTASATVRTYQSTGPNPDPLASTLIAAALAQNRITKEQELMYRAFALFADDRLPAEFQGAPSTSTDHKVLREISARLSSLSPAAQEILLPFLLPPIYDQSWFGLQLAGTNATAPPAPGLRQMNITPNCAAAANPDLWSRRSTAHFNIFYFTGGVENAGSHVIDLLASIVEEVYSRETNLLKRLPLPDTAETCNGGDAAVDIYLCSMGNPKTLGGVASYPNRCEKVPSFVMINSASTVLRGIVSAPAAVLEQSRSVVKNIFAHEFLHVLQLAMDRPAECRDYEWLDEATAEWIMDYIDPALNLEDGFTKLDANRKRSGSYLAAYLLHDHMWPIEEFASGEDVDPTENGYCDYLFFQYIARKFGSDIIKQIIDATAAKGSVEAVESALGPHGGFKAVWPEFAKTLWNDTTGKLLDDWSTLDKYDYGLAALFSQQARPSPPNLRTLEVDQKGEPRAKFELLKNTIKHSFSGNYELQQRSLIFEHLKFTDPTVRSALFFNPIGALPDSAREYLKVQAWKKIGGAWKEPEDWTADTHKQFCLDKQEERLEELLILVSNSDPDRNRGLPMQIDKRNPMQVSTSNVGCWQWEGTSSIVFTGDFGTRTATAANLTFEAASNLPGRMIFETISGKVTGNQDQPLGECRIVIGGMEKTITKVVRPAAPDGVIHVNLDLDLGFTGIGGEPPNRKLIDIKGATTLFTTTTFLCPTFSQSTSNNETWEWLTVENSGDYSVSNDGQTIEGNVTTPTPVGVNKVTFKFTARRQ